VIVTGIDPGCSGWIVTCDTSAMTAVCYPIPFYDDNIVMGIGEHIRDSDMIWMERLWGCRGAGAFKFGGVYYQLLAQLRDYPHELVTPQHWQAAMIGKGPSGTTKIRAREVFKGYIRAWDKLIGNDLIDAFLISQYGLCQAGINLKGWEIIKH